MRFTSNGMPAEEVIDSIDATSQKSGLVKHDIEKNLTGSYPLTGLNELRKVVLRTFSKFADSNLTTPAEEGVRQMEREVISMVAGLWMAPGSPGLFLSSGSESNFVALYVARRRMKARSGSVIFPITAHPSVLKACDWLGLTPIILPVRSDFLIDPELVRSSIRKDTIAILATCGSLPWAVVDPIEEIGKVADEHSLFFHVDAARAGFICPWLRRAGYRITPFDFRLRGISSISSDPHKQGYSIAPSSVIIFREQSDMELAAFKVGTPRRHNSYGIMGGRPGAPVAVTWAVFNFLGEKGFMNLSERAMKLTMEFFEKTEKIGDLECPTRPELNIANLSSGKLDMNKFKNELKNDGWTFFESEGESYSPSNMLAVSFMHYHDRILPKFLNELERLARKLKTK